MVDVSECVHLNCCKQTLIYLFILIEMVAFKELDRNAHSKLHLDKIVDMDPHIRYENANRNEQSEPHLNENVAIFGFGDSLEYVSGISLRFKTKLHLHVNKLYKV